MATEKELGYEPSLLIEMVKHRENGKITNRALVEKDRYNYLNGDEIDFTPHKGVDMKNILSVFEKVKPHFQHLNLAGKHFDSLNEANSQDMYPDLEHDEWPSEQRSRTIISEEIQGEILKYYPGQTVEEKKTKADLLETFFNSRSWTKISEQTSSDFLKRQFVEMKNYLEEKHQPEQPEVESETIGDLELNDLKQLIDGDGATIIYIKNKWNVKDIKELTVAQYMEVRDMIRQMNNSKIIKESVETIAA